MDETENAFPMDFYVRDPSGGLQPPLASASDRGSARVNTASILVLSLSLSLHPLTMWHAGDAATQAEFRSVAYRALFV